MNDYYDAETFIGTYEELEAAAVSAELLAMARMNPGVRFYLKGIEYAKDK